MASQSGTVATPRPSGLQLNVHAPSFVAAAGQAPHSSGATRPHVRVRHAATAALFMGLLHLHGCSCLLFGFVPLSVFLASRKLDQGTSRERRRESRTSGESRCALSWQRSSGLC